MGTHAKSRRETPRHRGDRAPRGGHRAATPDRPTGPRLALTLTVVATVAAIGVGGGLATRTDVGTAQPTPRSDSPPSQSPTTTLAGEAEFSPSVPEGTQPPDPASTTQTKERRKRATRPVVVPERASGRFPIAAVLGSQPADPTHTYEVAVEEGLPIQVRPFVRSVNSILSDSRGWTATGQYRLAQSGPGAAIRIVLASPDRVDELCAPLQTGGRVSCRNGRDVVINAWRWINSADTYPQDREGYRRYLINHEFGHALGYGHQPCTSSGALAAVMVQQTISLQGCQKNPWPALVDLK